MGGAHYALNDILCCQLCPPHVNARRTASTLSEFGTSSTNVLCRSGSAQCIHYDDPDAAISCYLERKYINADPNTVLSITPRPPAPQSPSDVTPILNGTLGISATDCALPFGSGAKHCRSKR